MARNDKDKNDDHDNSNFFVRFKHHVDANVSTGVKTIFGPPSDSPSDPNPPSASQSAVMEPPRAGFRSHSDRADDPRDRLATGISEETRILSGISHYSPMNLRDLPQPVPNDIEPGMDPTLFSFKDAFEDLLAVQKGHELPPIKMRYEQSKLLRFMYPSGEPLRIWRERLRAQGLMPPRSTPNPQFAQMVPESPLPAGGQTWQDAMTKSLGIWKAVLADGDEAQELRNILTNIIGELEKIPKQPRQPDNEEDLSSAVKSKWAEDRNTSWDSLVKALNCGPDALFTEFRSRAERLPPNVEPLSATKLKKVVNTEEHVDRFGFRHTTTTTRFLDENGREVGTESYVKVSSFNEEPGTSEPRLQPESEGSGEGSGEGEAKRPRKIPAWFWKKD